MVAKIKRYFYFQARILIDNNQSNFGFVCLKREDAHKEGIIVIIICKIRFPQVSIQFILASHIYFRPLSLFKVMYRAKGNGEYHNVFMHCEGFKLCGWNVKCLMIQTKLVHFNSYNLSLPKLKKLFKSIVLKVQVVY